MVLYVNLLHCQLLIGNIEKNPGPVTRKKRIVTRCDSCIRFVRKDEKTCENCRNKQSASSAILNEAVETNCDFQFDEAVADCSNQRLSYDYLPEAVEVAPIVCDVFQPSMSIVDTSDFANHPSDHAAAVSSSLTEDVVVPLSVQLEQPNHLRHPTSTAFHAMSDSMSLPRGHISHSLPSILLPSHVPLRTYPVPANGNCLFGTLAALITGSCTEPLQRFFRTLICIHIPLMPFTPSHFETYGPAGCSNGSDYVRQEKMNDDGTYAGDLEIITFCNIFSVRVFAYISSSSRWIIYSPLHPAAHEFCFVIVLYGRHWEPVTALNSGSSVFPNIEPSKPHLKRPLHCPDQLEYTSVDRFPIKIKDNCKKAKPNTDTLQTSPPISRADVLISNGESNAKHNFDYDFLNIHTPHEECVIDATPCSSCDRVSTSFYPIKLTEVEKSKLVKRKFMSLPKVGAILLCTLCSSYGESGKPQWQHAWPCVLKFYLKDSLLRSILPIQLLSSWNIQSHSDVKTRETSSFNGVFVDVTRQMNDFQYLINCFTSADYVTAMDRYNLPSIRCFCGGSVFLYECGTVGFNHLIHYMFKEFTSFDSNYTKYINCIRSDFFLPCDEHLPFLLRPSVVVNAQGLMLATCTNHDGGTSLRMIHVARHPTCGSLAHPQENRLAAVVPSLRGATALKVGEFSNTWTIAKSIGGAQGIGSLLLHTHRRLNIKSQFLLPEKENLFYRCRLDMKEHITHIMENHKVSFETLFGNSSYKPLSDDKISKFVSAASYVPLNVSLAIKSHHDSNNSLTGTFAKPLITFATSHGPHPIMSGPKLAQSNYLLSLFYILFSNNRLLNALLFLRKNAFIAFIADILLNDNVTIDEKISKFLPFAQNSNNTLLLSELLSKYAEATVISTVKTQQVPNHGIVIWSGRNCSSTLLDEPWFAGNSFMLLETTPQRSLYNVQLRYEDSTGWWNLNMLKGMVKKRDNVLRNRIRLIITSAVPTAPPSVLTHISGQNIVRCPHHSLLLCVDFRSSGYFCSAAKTCNNQSKWRCPFPSCGITLCQKHVKEAEEANFCFNYRTRRKDIDTNCGHSEEEPVLPTPCSESEDQFFPPVPVSDITDTYFDTDAAVPAAPIEVESSRDDMTVIPVQAMFNSFMTVLNRPRVPPSTSARFRRAIQCLAATKPQCAISLLQLEAFLFPSIFYYQMTDGSFPGALPFFLFTDQKTAKQFAFEDLLQHFTSRLTDLTLPTSSSVQYIQFAVDCLINLALGHHHSSVFFRKGLQTLEARHKKVKLFSRDMLFDCNDGQIRLRELVAAVTSHPVDCFLTLSCNQVQHPGTAGILKAVKDKFYSFSDEIREASINSMLTSIVRAWSNSVQFLIELLKKSTENILGRVRKIWARAEFQTTAGNLPHYHILIWCEPGTFSVDQSIQCAKKTIYNKLEEIFHSNLKLLGTYQELSDAYELCVRLHTHDCEKSGFRCMKRKDASGQRLCRTPPFPQSHCNWKLVMKRSYPVAALELLLELGLAQYVGGNPDWLEPCCELISEKHMYAATKGEHLVATCAHLFLITSSSTNLLATDQQMSCSYLTYYSSKVEEHADAKITAGNDGKCFRLRTDGIVNKNLSTVRHCLDQDKKRERSYEKIDCSMLSVTEGVHWLLRLPLVITNMVFIHIPNIPPENRFVSVKRFSQRLPKVNQLRTATCHVEQWRKISHSQQVLLFDIEGGHESYDKMALFNLRPPELLCINDVELFFKCFDLSPNSLDTQILLSTFQYAVFSPWIHCLGHWVRLRSSAVPLVELFLKNQLNTPPVTYSSSILNKCKDDEVNAWWWLLSDTSQLLPEIVFKSVSPRNVIPFLVSFVLRFGKYDTELDLFFTCDLIDSFIYAGLIPREQFYTRAHVLHLLSMYTRNELLYLPGGSVTFSAKLITAESAFAQLLNVNGTASTLDAPTVLLENISDNLLQSVLSHKEASQQSLYEQVSTLNVSNLLHFPRVFDNLQEWLPQVIYPDHQSRESREEQNTVIQRVINSIRARQGSIHNLLRNKNEIILGPPGSGKSHVCRILLSYALMNGLVSMVTSLAARRSNQLGGEHIHRLFGIPVENIAAGDIAEKAIVKLTNDPKRQHLLRHLQFLIVEEISVVNAELFSAMDLLLQKVKDNFSPFGGVFVLANGDCMQLPNVSGRDVFLSSSLLYGFNFIFLTNLVRMVDRNGQRLLRLMETRPISQSNIEEVVDLFSAHCVFVVSWADLDPTIMKVFGKKAAEREAVDRHLEAIRASGSSHYFIQAKDELRLSGSHSWRDCSADVSKFLDRTVREPARLLVYAWAVVQFSRNLATTQQGSLGVVDYEASTASFVSVFVAPSPADITRSNIESRLFRNWRKILVHKMSGFTYNYKGNSARRHQIPLTNYVASNCHRLLGDEFPRVATAISVTESKYALWLPSQIFVIGSRIKALNCLYFVGDKQATLDSIRKVLSITNLHEERVYKFFRQVRNSSINRSPLEIPTNPFMRANFNVPETSGGFVMVLVSLKDNFLKDFLIRQTCQGLSDYLRRVNSTVVEDSDLYSRQPWTVGAYIWNFGCLRQRHDVFSSVIRLRNNRPDDNIVTFSHFLRQMLQSLEGHVLFCFPGVVRSDVWSTNYHENSSLNNVSSE